ncbi:TetR/AcrR family transcriptional regulator [Streptomyces blattellae]|uniref:TetR/AcrR family transcriptional regulator n=1 Tax=Streptomyces blattellae TaxID=2569855 RepID=UPI0018ACA48F|nr:TetR/AcrR family transcriptional regulator [Streptomyces blattellae]
MANTEKYDRTGARELSSAPSVERIIDAALELFAEHGYNSTIAQISEAAGVSRALLFHHFGSKEGILRAVIDQVSSEVMQVFQQSDDLTGISALRTYLEERSRFFRERPQVARLLMVLGAQAIVAKRSRPTVLEIEDRKLEFLTRCISEAVDDGSLRSDVDVEKLALLLAAVTDGDVRMWGIDPKRRPVEQTNGAILDMLRLLGSPRPS